MIQTLWEPVGTVPFCSIMASQLGSMKSKFSEEELDWVLTSNQQKSEPELRLRDGASENSYDPLGTCGKTSRRDEAVLAAIGIQRKYGKWWDFSPHMRKENALTQRLLHRNLSSSSLTILIKTQAYRHSHTVLFTSCFQISTENSGISLSITYMDFILQTRFRFFFFVFFWRNSSLFFSLILSDILGQIMIKLHHQFFSVTNS